MYRILTLDGGGCWSVLQVMALRELFAPDTTGHAVLASFDLVAANSGGSLVLGGLIENMPLGDLYDLFQKEENRRKIFTESDPLEFPENAVLNLIKIGAKYSTEGKLAGLRELLPRTCDKKLAALPTVFTAGLKCPDVMICGFDFDLARGVLFRSSQTSRAASFGAPFDPTVAEAINASSDAPVIEFDAPACFGDRQFWDGGVAGYNNPVLVAVIEALANGVAAADIRALSLGTGTVWLPFDPNGGPDGLVRGPQASTPVKDLIRLTGSIVDDPPDVASFQAHVTIGGALPARPSEVPASSPVVRLSPLVQPVPVPGQQGQWAPPSGFDLDAFTALQDVPIDALDPDQFKLIVRLGEAWIKGDALNQPVRVNRDTLACEIGYRTFQAGEAAYKTWWVPDALARAA